MQTAAHGGILVLAFRENLGQRLLGAEAAGDHLDRHLRAEAGQRHHIADAAGAGAVIGRGDGLGRAFSTGLLPLALFLALFFLGGVGRRRGGDFTRHLHSPLRLRALARHHGHDGLLPRRGAQALRRLAQQLGRVGVDPVVRSCDRLGLGRLVNGGGKAQLQRGRAVHHSLVAHDLPRFLDSDAGPLRIDRGIGVSDHAELARGLQVRIFRPALRQPVLRRVVDEHVAAEPHGDRVARHGDEARGGHGDRVNHHMHLVLIIDERGVDRLTLRGDAASGVDPHRHRPGHAGQLLAHLGGSVELLTPPVAAAAAVELDLVHGSIPDCLLSFCGGMARAGAPEPASLSNTSPAARSAARSSAISSLTRSGS